MQRLTRIQAHELDRLASEVHGLPVRVLMENAGLLAALEIEAIYRTDAAERGGPVRIFCGAGNNGGDGFVIARQLQARSVPVVVECTHPGGGSAGASQHNRRSAESLGVRILPLATFESEPTPPAVWSDASVFVDALLGTGFQGPVRAPLDGQISVINLARRRFGIPTVAIDLPSGLDSDSGRPGEPTIEADWTLTFAAEKVGFGMPEARAYLGQVRVLPIGVCAARVLGGKDS